MQRLGKRGIPTVLRTKQKKIMSRSRQSTPRRGTCTLKHAVFSKSPEISKYLNCQSLWKYFQKQELRFLTRKERDLLQQEPSETEKATKLLDILDRKPELAVRKFIVCLLLEREHRGHRELIESILPKISPKRREKIYQLVEANTEDPVCKDSCAPPKPVSFIYLDGDLSPEMSCTLSGPATSTDSLIYFTGDLSLEKNCTFLKLDEKLWELFSTANYSNLEELISRIRLSAEAPHDWKIIGSWFQALIVMHRDHEYSTCIETILEPALQDCTNSENRTILEGRILQRIAQVYLVTKEKDKAQEYFAMAKEKLQFVGGGYDKANMFCREAKLLSTTCSTQEERDKTEELFEIALCNVPNDAPYALASKPSLILSKTAFHLHLSFGKGTVGAPPHVSTEDLAKARETLKHLSREHIILDIRKCEYSLLMAELTRLEGNWESAAEGYQRTVQLSAESKLANISDIAKHRSDYVQRELSNRETCNKLLEGLP